MKPQENDKIYIDPQEYNNDVRQFNIERNKKQVNKAKQSAGVAGIFGGGCITGLAYIALVLLVVGVVYYLGALITCGIWNHMIVPAFGLPYTITLFQGFVVWFALSFIGGFFTVQGGKNSE